MDNSFHRQASDPQQKSGFSASLQIFDRIINWLVDLIKLTKAEQEAAGVYPGRLGDK